MDVCAYIMDIIGEPDNRWPKHSGHLDYNERMRLVVFLFANGVSPALIGELAGYAPWASESLVNEDAKREWARLVKSCVEDKAFRARYYARDLISGDVVYLDGRVKYNAPSCTVVTPNGKHVDMRQHEIDAFAGRVPREL